MKRYRRGWLAKAIGDTTPEDELMVVLTVRKRLIEGFGQMIARSALQMTLRPTPQTSPERLGGPTPGDDDCSDDSGNDDDDDDDEDLEASMI